ncbi:MAG: ABC transporter permease [Fimbriimonadales bacterium]
MLSTLQSLILGTMALSAPLVLAAMGGYVSERSGIINIALEGKMLTAACVGYVSTLFWHNPWLALCAAIASAVLMSLVHWLLTQKYRLDHIISGMALNALAAGATNYLYLRYTDLNTGELPTLPMPFFWTLAFAFPFLLFAYSRYTRAGLRLLAVGNDPDKSRMLGIQPSVVRLLALTATGVFTGLAGAMIYTSAGQFTEGMTSGRGFIALAALILGGWRPLQALGACLAFGFFEALQLQLQGTKVAGADIPAEVFSSLPYIITVIALAGLLGRSQAPAGLGKI